MSLTASHEDKISWLSSEIKDVLDAHAYRTFNVERRVRDFMVGMDTNADVEKVLGNPIAYARVWLDGIDQRPRQQDENFTIYGSRATVSHRFGVLIEYQFIDSDTEVESSTFEFMRLLEREEDGEPVGLMSHLRNLGSVSIGNGCTAATEGPERIILPSFPIESQGGTDSFVHYCEFTFTLT